MKKFILLIAILAMVCGVTFAQSSQGYIINIENGKVYVDLSSPKVKVGDAIGVYVRSGYETDPVTGRRVRKPDELKAELKISSVHQGYSLAYPIGGVSVTTLKAGMMVKRLESTSSHNLAIEQNTANVMNPKNTSDYMRETFVSSSKDLDDYQHHSKEERHQTFSPVSSDKATVVVAPAHVNDVVNSGHFGGYVADVLMEQLLMCNEVRLLDRSVLNAQIDEVNLAGDIIDPNTAIQRGKVVGAKYIIQVTMRKPDVVNERTGIPLASVMGAIGMATGKNVGAQYASNMQIGTLRASVSINVRVVDLQTGEVLFMTSGTGKAKGKSQLALEYGALGGGEINGGADGFKQTITGKAIQKAFVTIGRNLRNYFAGNTDKKVIGSTTGYGSYGQHLAARGMKLYLGTEKLDKEGVQMTLSENQHLFFKYKNAKRKHRLGTWAMIGGVLLGGLIGTAVSENTDGSTPNIIVGASVACGIVGGLCLYSSAKKEVRQVANEYNRSQTSYADASLNIVLDKNNIGLRLTF